MQTSGQGRIKAPVIALEGGWFKMGAKDGPHPEDGEGPVRDVFVDAFSLAATAVTIAEFAEFADATGYRTAAESAGVSLVFHACVRSGGPYPAVERAPWWYLVPGACWHAPHGSGGDISGMMDHPVTHIAHEDARAFCLWSNARLPTEAEWEFAARGGLEQCAFPWGDDPEPDGERRCNIWQSAFPHPGREADDFTGTVPARFFPPNRSGFFNMTGNVWEWVSDRFTVLHSPRPARNPKGPLNGRNHVAKGGSYLCNEAYCSRYRTSSRQSLCPETTTGNLGFRVAKVETPAGA